MCTYMYARLFWWWWCPLPCLPDWYSLLSYLFKYVPDLHFCSAEGQSSQIFVAEKHNQIDLLLISFSAQFHLRPFYSASVWMFEKIQCQLVLKKAGGIQVWGGKITLYFLQLLNNSTVLSNVNNSVFFCFFFLHLVGVSSAANSSPGQKISCHWCQVSSNKSKFWPDLFLLEYNFLPRRHPPPILVEIKFFVSFSLFPSLQKKM